MVGPREWKLLEQDVLARAAGGATGSTSGGGTARTTWCGQLSIATPTPSAPSVATERLDAVAVRRHGDQSRRGQVARRLETAHDRPEPAQLALERPIGLENARGGQGQDLAAAMAEHRVGPQAQPGQHLVQGPLGVEDDVDRRRGRPELFITAGHRDRTDARSGGSCLAQVAGDPVGRVEQATHFGKMEAEVGEHPGYCDPSPGKRKARPPAAVVSSGSSQ